MVELEFSAVPVRPAAVAAWRSLPTPLLMSVRGSLAPSIVKAMFDFWGARDDGDHHVRGYVLTVDSGDPSVSTEFTNSLGQWCTLSLNGDGLTLAVEAGGERDVQHVPAGQLDRVELFEDWLGLVQLH